MPWGTGRTTCWRCSARSLPGTPTWWRSGTSRSTCAVAPSTRWTSLLRAGAERVGVTDIDSYPTELASLQALLKLAEPGDVVGLMCHAERQEVYDWLEAQGATADTPEQLRAKVLRAR